MVAINHKHHKAVAKAAAGESAKLSVQGGNRIATHADDVATNMDQMYATLANEIQATRTGQVAVNNIPKNLSPVVEEAAMQQRARAGQIVDEAAAMEVQRNAESTARTDAFVGYADTAMTAAGFAPMIIPLAQKATGAAGWVATKAGNLTGVKALTGVGDKIGNATSRSWNELSFNELGEMTRTKGVIGKVAQTSADIVSGPVHWLGEKTGFSSWRAGSNAASAVKELDAARSVAGQLTMNDLSIVGGLKSRVNAGFDASHLATAEGKNMISIARSAAENGQLSAAGTKFLESVESSVTHHEGAAMWGNVKGAIKGSPSAIGKGSASHGLMNAAFIGGSALSMFGDARTFSQNLESLRQMYADMTGEDVKNVSTVKLLTGSVPESVAAARSHLIKQFGIKQAFDIGNIALNAAMILNHKMASGWKAFAAFGAVSAASMAVDAVMGESILPIHKAFSDAYKTGQEIPPQFYEAYIFAASKDLRSHGEKGQEFARQVAQEYAAEKVSPGQLLREIESGKLMERVKNITAKADRAQAGVQEDTSQEQAVMRTSAQRGERPVVGKFTNKLNQEAQMATVGHGLA